MAPKFWYLYSRYISSLSTVQYSAKLRNFKSFYLTTQIIVASNSELFHINRDMKQQQWCKFSLNFDVLWTCWSISEEKPNLHSFIKFQIFETRKIYYFSSRVCCPNFYPENRNLVQAQNLKLLKSLIKI